MLLGTLWHLPFLLGHPFLGPAQPLSEPELRLAGAPVRFLEDYSPIPAGGFYDAWALNLTPRRAPPVPLTFAWSRQGAEFSSFGGSFQRVAGPLDLLLDYAYLKDSLGSSKQGGFAWLSGKCGHLGLLASSGFHHAQAGARWRWARGLVWFGEEDLGGELGLGPLYASAERVEDTLVYEAGVEVLGAKLGLQRWGEALLPSFYLAGNWLSGGWRRLPGRRAWWLGARALWGPAEARALVLDGELNVGLAASDTLKYFLYRGFARYSPRADTLEFEARLLGGPVLSLFSGGVKIIPFGEFWERGGEWWSAGVGGLFYGVLYLEAAYDSGWAREGWRFGAWVRMFD